MAVDRYYAAAIQTDFAAPRSRAEIGGRVDRLCEIARHAVIGYEPFHDVRLLVYPEFAHTVPIHQEATRLHDDLAVELPGEHSDRYVALCRELGCFIQTGTFLEVDSRWPGAVFNTTLLVGPSGVLSRYRKVNTWIPWEVHTSPHDIEDYPDPVFPVADTELGRLGVAICYDWLFPETLRQITANGAEIIARVSAYMDPWGTASPLDWWTLINRTRALENMVWVVAANQGATLAHYPPFSWPGGSMIVDFDGRIQAQAEAGGGERIVVGPVDLGALRAERARRRGHQTLAHLRAEVHDYLNATGLPRGEDVNTMATIESRIAAARQKLT